MTYSATVISGGKIVMPAELRREFGMNDGGSLVIERGDAGHMVVRTRTGRSASAARLARDGRQRLFGRSVSGRASRRIGGLPEMLTVAVERGDDPAKAGARIARACFAIVDVDRDLAERAARLRSAARSLGRSLAIGVDIRPIR